MAKCTVALTSILVLAAASDGQILPGFPFREDTHATPSAFQVELEMLPLEPITDQDRQFLVEMLPKQGQVVKYSNTESQKLGSLRAFLASTRPSVTFAPVVIDVTQAFLGLYERAILLISLPALRLLSIAELQALAAHEMGHAFAWPVYSAAKLRGDAATLREVESWCDAFAVVTLMRAGFPPANLVSAIRGITNFNARQFGSALNEDDYPRIGDRLDRLRRTIAWASGAGTAGPTPQAPVRTARK